jgi:hypothetical protein
MIEILNKLDSEGMLKQLFNCGLLNWTVLRDRDIYLKYDTYIKQGRKSMEAKQFTADEFKISMRSVEKAIKKMKTSCVKTVTH